MKIEKTVESIPSNEYVNHYTSIDINAHDVRRNADGTWCVLILTRPLSTEEEKVLMHLFPHTFTEVEMLLSREALVGSIVDNR